MLRDKDRYRNIISNKDFTLRVNNKGFWYLNGESDKLKPCSASEMIVILNTFYTKIHRHEYYY